MLRIENVGRCIRMLYHVLLTLSTFFLTFRVCQFKFTLIKMDLGYSKII